MQSVTRTLSYLHGDHLGSASLTTDASGQKVSEQRYKPYGEVRWSSGPGMPTDFTFTGQRASSYGTIFMSAREYLPSLGRFLSAENVAARTLTSAPSR
jgi:RHS repeat-associated protein